MVKIPKEVAKRHNLSLDLVHSDRALTLDERIFILENFHEGATNMNGLAGAFFTPEGLARDLSIEVPEGTIIDLCAGIGMLSFACRHRASRIICVEQNPEYAAAGKRVMPEADWIVGDVFSIDKSMRFKCAISNPPFGNIKAGSSFKGNYTGSSFEYKVIELASRVAEMGVFIVPQASAPFRYSGAQHYSTQIDKECKKFIDQTGLELGMNCGIDTSAYLNEWKGVSPMCEIVVCEFPRCNAEAQDSTEEQLDLFAIA